MKILSEDVRYLPTLEGYRQSVTAIGVHRRTLDGSMDTHRRAVKRGWTLTLVDPDRELYESLIPRLSGEPFDYEDLDGKSYSVVLMGLVPSGISPVFEVTITLEEA